jgi:hypothetical protein
MNDVYFIDGVNLPMKPDEVNVNFRFVEKQVNIEYSVEGKADALLERTFWYDIFG